MVLTFIFMVALVVDIGRVEIFLRTVQGAADAAALAGADRFRLTQSTGNQELAGGYERPYLNGNPVLGSSYKIEKHQGYRRAKEVVFASLNQSSLVSRYGNFMPTQGTPCLSAFPGGFTAPDATSPVNWACYQYQFGTAPQTIRVTVERGVYYEKGDTKVPTFLNLESLFRIDSSTPAQPQTVESTSMAPNINACAALGVSAGKLPSKFFPIRCGTASLPGNGPETANLSANWRVGEQEPLTDSLWPNWRYSPYTIANAVRVVITLNSMPTLLAGFSNIGFSAFSNITSRETIASRGIARDQELAALPSPRYDPW